MNLKEHYDALYTESVAKIRSGEYQTDPLIGDPDDKRYGITLILRPDSKTLKNIAEFLNNIKQLEPEQYYYPLEDIHITVLSIISGNPNFRLNDINPNDYIGVINKALINTPPFKLEFRGITASPSCVLLQGFTEGNALNRLRDSLRDLFKVSSLQQSIDKRYSIQTAHSTVIRFSNPLKNPKIFAQALDGYRQEFFGDFTVESLDLVANDWYLKNSSLKLLQRFDLKANHP